MHKIVYVKTQSGKQYMYLGDKESFKIGDIVSNDKHDNMEVINVFDSEKDTYNGHPIKQLIFINSFLFYYINYKCIFELSTC